jgi:hypothetical protein
MIAFDLTFAIPNDDEAVIATLIHEKFCRTFEPRFSDYLGGDYYLGQGSPEIVVHKNLDGNEVAEADFADFGVLIQINGCEDREIWKNWIGEVGGILVRETQYDVARRES